MTRSKLSKSTPNRKLRRSRVTRSTGDTYDSLEPRLALTAFVVNTIADDGGLVSDGLVSLREAIVASNNNMAFGDAVAGDASGDTITFAPAIAGQTITLSLGELEISDDLRIQGGDSNMTLGGNSLVRHFSITTAENVSISKLTLINGRADQGGSISATGGGTVLIHDVDFNANAAIAAGGGAIYHETGNLYINGGSVFDGNIADVAAGSGGAILSASGVVATTGSEFYNNVARRAGGAIEIIDGQFFAVNSILGATGQGNFAGRAADGAPGNGGALHVTGTATVVINGGTVEGNVAQSEGGGLWNQAGSTMIVRNGTVVSDNVARGDAADEGGGGIFNNGGRLVVNNATVSDNETTGAASSGGGVFSTDGRVLFIDSSLTDNATVRAGGGVEVIDGIISFLRTDVIDNSAGLTMAAPGNGGGFHVTGTATTIVEDSDFTENFAAKEGGGLWNQAGSLMYISNSRVEGNDAAGADADDGGGGIFNNGGRVFVAGTLIDDNEANGAAGSGGGIFSTDGVFVVRDSTISNNDSARAGGGAEIIDGALRIFDSLLTGNDTGNNITAAPGNGGAIHVTGAAAIVNLDNVDVVANTAASQGGGLWNQTGSQMLVRNGSRVVENTTAGVGGGIYNKGYLQLFDSVAARNEASSNGGGVFVTDTGRSLIQDSRVSNNDGGDEGGGLWNGGRVVLRDSIFASNTASVDGGGVFNTDSAFLGNDGTTIVANSPNDVNA